MLINHILKMSKLRSIRILRKFLAVGESRCSSSHVRHTSTMNELAKRKSKDASKKLESDLGSYSYSKFEENFFNFLSEGQEKTPLSRFTRGIKSSGLWSNDPRLLETMTKVNELVEKYGSDDILLDRNALRDIIKDNIVLIRRAFINDFVIPEFAPFCANLDEIYWSCRSNATGKVSTYVPMLSGYSPNYWGVSVCTVDGQRHSIGDVTVPFTIQSSGMPISYAFAVNEHGADVVHQYVGHEPSAEESVRSMRLNDDHLPHNPLSNAGALVVTSLLKSNLSLSDRFNFIKNHYQKLSGGEHISFNNAVFLNEREIGDRNYALGYYLRDNKCFPDGINLSETMDLYFQLCSIEINVNSGAVIAATLANGGYCPITEEHVLSSTAVRNTLSLMHSCGMYDYSGGFAFKVGLPGKAGISGGILLVVPNVLGMFLWSPPLDDCGNSVRGLQFCEQLVRSFNFHHYSCRQQSTLGERDPRAKSRDLQGNQVVKLLFSACYGDLTSLRRIHLSNQDISVTDYDGRTALHLAASEGHLDCVQFLLEKCQVPVDNKDRWGHTPYDDSKRFGHTEVEKYLKSYCGFD